MEKEIISMVHEPCLSYLLDHFVPHVLTILINSYITHSLLFQFIKKE